MVFSFLPLPTVWANETDTLIPSCYQGIYMSMLF